MNADRNKPFVAIDVGNSQIMAGLFSPKHAVADWNHLPQPNRTLSLQSHDWDPMEFASWLAPKRSADVDWFIGSVCDQASCSLEGWLEREPDKPLTRLLRFTDMTLGIEIPAPASIGIDRLLGAVAANHIRSPDCPCLIIDLGSAITVDVISAQGSFRGGAILPGMQMSGRALHAFTDRLPLIDLSEEPPLCPVGRSTEEAISSGIYWGTVGALQVLINQLRTELPSDPMIIVTGGNAPLVVEGLEAEVRYEPNLILAGIAIVVDSIRQADRDD